MFEYDGTLVSVMNKIMYVVSANLLFIACSLPIVTTGASAAAMYAVLLGAQSGKEKAIIPAFFKSFKDTFVPATVLWLGMMITAGTMWLNYRLTAGFHGHYEVVRIFCNLVAVLLALLWVYAFPAMAYFTNTLRGYLQFALAISISYLPQTALLIVLQAGPLILILFLAQFSRLFTILFFLCGFSIGVYLSAPILNRIFCRYGQEKNEESTAC